ncbi:BTB/POZ domain-containing protein KCTD19-like [Strongylocentrotus purpuratus]|uniref:BTB domain-containing protein n=1 Tax=Strongylocentrotus purpuratus TaxID=7668 RepID=A0A7M7T4C4_STRPU|nr:BTB/POZ domain-containing protein KCTD19-like [Strongylocentrotus purpuratus]
MNMASSVILNVGGKLYQTERSTLERYPDSYFTSLLNDNHYDPSIRNEEGHYIVDRDGEIFRHVLNFLRDGRLVLPDGFREYELLRCEAKFFKLGELQKAIPATSLVKMASSVILNVGGKLYQTKRSTLERLIDVNDPSIRNEEGHYLLDRDGEIFRHVLNFLRSGRLVLPDGFREYDLLRCEAKFFKLGELQKAIPATSSVKMASSLTLNVGGKLYQTKRSTLERLIDVNDPSIRNEEGHYLVDRDGEIFRHVLNFLRSGRLVLPDGFREYDLLRCEAEFFKLGELQKAIQEQTRGAIGLRVGGKLYMMTIGEASKEQGSFFDKMLSGQISVPRDALGNFLVDRDGSMFRFVLGYLRDGGIFMDMTPKEFDLLKKEGEYFGLQMLVHHIESVSLMHGWTSGKPLILHLFHHNNDHCVVYANRAKAGGFFTDWKISEICSEPKILKDDIMSKEGRLVGLLDVTKVNHRQPAKKEEIFTFIFDKMGAKHKKSIQLNNGWTKVLFTT